MIKKIILTLFIALMFTVTGTSNPSIILQNFVFHGENDSWIAEYKTNYMGCFSEGPNGLSYDSSGNAVLTVTYKKDISLLSSVKQLGLAYQTGNISGSLVENYDEGGLKQKKFIFRNDNGILIQEDAIPTVTVNLDGNIQIIELKNEAVS